MREATCSKTLGTFGPDFYGYHYNSYPEGWDAAKVTILQAKRHLLQEGQDALLYRTLLADINEEDNLPSLQPDHLGAAFRLAMKMVEDSVSRVTAKTPVKNLAGKPEITNHEAEANHT